MRMHWAFFSAALTYAFLATAGWSQDVTLTSRDKSVEIVGTLLGYDGEFYRVDSVYGVLTLDGSGVVCSGPGCPDLEAYVANIRMAGSVTIADVLMPVLIQSFAQQQEYSVDIQSEGRTTVFELSDLVSGQVAARFRISASNSDEGFADLLAEDADLALSLREATNIEISRGIEAGLGDLSSVRQSHVLALDALVPVVSPRNPVQHISPEDLAAIFLRQTENWADLGGLDAPVALHLLRSNSGLMRVFENRIVEPSGQVLPDEITRHATVSSLLNAVASDPFAIGLAPLSEQSGIRPLALAGGCGFRASAIPEALKSDDYPLTAPVFMYLRSQRLPAVAREFMRFVRSPAAQIAIIRSGFVDQTISRTPIGRQGDRLANAIRAAGGEVTLADLKNLVTAMDGARRLSVTFRFDDGSSHLTAQSLSNVALLARALETGSLGAKELLFAGFSDGEGGAAKNRSLSKERAASVRAAVLQEATTADPRRVRLRIEGFGETLPMACDDTEWGRQINRRVEVWAR